MSTTNKKSNKALKIIAQILGFVFLTLCAVVIFFNLTHEYHIVSGSSMVPTLNNGSTDGVFVSKIKSYSRGDIIVADKGEKDEKGNNIFVIKRLIAVGGDKIKITTIDGYCRVVLKIEGEQEVVLDEPYLLDYSVNNGLNVRFEKMISDCLLSTDEQGFLEIGQDEIFYLGDNRLVSNDCSVYGPKKKSLVVGKVDYIAYGNTNVYWQVIKQVFGGK